MNAEVDGATELIMLERPAMYEDLRALTNDADASYLGDPA